jgi:hypothetical protein
VGRPRPADHEDLVPDDAGRDRAFSALVVFESSRLSRTEDAEGVLAEVWNLQRLDVMTHSVTPWPARPCVDVAAGRRPE